MNHEKNLRKKRPWPVSDISMEGTRKYEYPQNSTQYSVRHSNPGPAEFETGSLSTIERIKVIGFPPRPLNSQSLKQIIMFIVFINPGNLNMSSCLT